MNAGAQAYMELADHFRMDATAHERALRLVVADEPTLTQLRAAADKYGPDGVLESACHLSDEDYGKLAVHVRKVAKLSRWTDKPTRRRRA